MTTRALIITLLIVGPIVGLLAAYAGLVSEGTLPPPDFDAIARGIGLGTATMAQIIFFAAIAAIGFMAAIAPIIYAIRANDVLTVLISLALTGSAIAIAMSSHTVFDQISALILYLANTTLSAVVYAAHKIAPKV
jgi:hypothetical protein